MEESESCSRDPILCRDSDLQDFPPPPPDYYTTQHSEYKESHSEHKRSHSFCLDELISSSISTSTSTSTPVEPSQSKPTTRIKNRVDKKAGPREGMKHLSRTKEKLSNLDRISAQMERASENLLRASEKFDHLSLSMNSSTRDSSLARDTFEDDDFDDEAKLSPNDKNVAVARMRALSQGLMPGTTVKLRKSQLNGIVCGKSAFDRKLRYEIKMDQTDRETFWVDSNEVEIAEPPLGWIVEFRDDGGRERSGVVVGASWFRNAKKVEIEVEKNECVWKDFEDVCFSEPGICTKCAVVVDYGDAGANDEKRIRAGIVEGKRNFQGAKRFQVKFDDENEGMSLDGWFTLAEFVNPNDFR